jgi:uncharacterized membrane protein (TIGR02234 family)
VKARAQFGLALVVLAVGSGAALLISSRTWQTVRTPKDSGRIDVLNVSGRAIDTAPLAFALVALAGVVAVLATQGWVRRGIGALVAVAGALLALRSATAISAVSIASARSLVREKHSSVTYSSSVIPQVSTHPIWGALSIGCACLVMAAGAMIALRGGRWAAMSARYESPSAAQEQTVTEASLWSALDRGEDPTSSH